MNKENSQLSKFEPLHFKSEEYNGQAVICFTYDDGLLDNYQLAMFSHLEFGISATFAIIANRVLDSSFYNKFVNISQMREMSLMGFEISSHGYYHKTKFPELSSEGLDRELGITKKVLNALLPNDEEVTSICIPFGKANDLVIQEAYKHYDIVRLFGYRANKLEDVLEKPMDAYPILNKTDVDQVKRWIDKAVIEKKVITLMLHGIAENTDNKGDYYFQHAKLREILQYVSSLGQNKILPARLNDLSKIQAKVKKQGGLKKNKINETVLVETENYMITSHFHVTPTEKVIITFGGLPSTKTRKGFGSDFSLSLGYDTIFVAQKAKTQYQGLSLDAFYKYIHPLIKGRECITYGSSLGAYCAIYYAGIIDALAIAAAPKNSAHPLIGRSEYSKIGFNHTEIVDNPISKYSPVIIFDPQHIEEKRYIDKLIMPAYPKARLVEVPFSGHTVLNTMKLSKVLSPFMKALIEKNEIIEFELKTVDCYIWNAEKGRFLLKKGDVSEALKHLYLSLDLFPNKEAFEYLTNYLFSINNFEELQVLYKKYIKTNIITPTKATEKKYNKFYEI